MGFLVGLNQLTMNQGFLVWIELADAGPRIAWLDCGLSILTYGWVERIS
jgi:hypothetical protein